MGWEVVSVCLKCLGFCLFSVWRLLAIKDVKCCGDVVENCKVSSNIYAVILGCKLPQIATESGWNIIRWSEMHGKNFNQVKLFLPDMGLTLYPVLVWQPGHHSIISLQPVKTYPDSAHFMTPGGHILPPVFTRLSVDQGYLHGISRHGAGIWVVVWVDESFL